MEPVRICIRDAPQIFPWHALPLDKSVPSLFGSGSSFHNILGKLKLH